MIVSCHSCGGENERVGPPGRRDLCDHCGAALRCCLQCRHHDETAPSGCREPQAEVPRDREQANFCELFVAGSPAPRGTSEADRAKAAFEALFARSKGS